MFYQKNSQRVDTSGKRIKMSMPVAHNAPPKNSFYNHLGRYFPFKKKFSAAHVAKQELFEEAPFHLARISREPEKLLHASTVAENLRTYGLIDTIKKNRRIFHDVPEMISFRVHSHRFPKESMGYGSDFFDEEKALWRALGEAQERALWRFADYYSHTGTFGSYMQLSSFANCIDPKTIIGFTDQQRSDHLCLQYTNTTNFHWTKTTSLTTQKTYYCPTQLLSNRYTRDHCSLPHHRPQLHSTIKEPLLRWSITTGLGTGQTSNAALIAGINEIIERDAFMTTYLNKISPPQIDLQYVRTNDEEINKIISKFERYNLSVRVVRLVSDFPVNALCSIITDNTNTGPAIALATNVEIDFRSALLGALRENMAIYFMARGVKMDKKIKVGEVKDLNQKSRVKYWADKQQAKKLDFLYKNLTYECPDIDTNTLSEKEQVYLLKQACIDNQQLAYYVNLTENAHIDTGIHTINVVMPGMHPLHLLESIPYIETKRIHDVAKKCGYTPCSPVNTEPHPFP